ncbi:MAG: hypothetical protein WBF71_08415 [Microthrixaceae bacterium]
MYELSQAFANLTAATIVLAHQGGWDELLMVAVPVAVFAGLLYVANNRASKLGEEISDDRPVETGTDSTEFRGSSGTDKPGTGPVKHPLHEAPPRNPRGGPI